MGTKAAWALAALTAALVVADVVVTAQYWPLTSEEAVAVHGIPFISGAVLGSAVMGALVITSDRRQVIGWLLVGLGTAGATSMFLEAYSVWVLDHDGPGPSVGGSLSGWTSSLIGGQLAVTGLVLIFLLVPDGRFLTPRWRTVAALAVVGELLVVVGMLTFDPRTFDLRAEPAGGVDQRWRLLDTVGFLMISVALVAALVSMVLRLRRSTGVERQQLRVVALSAAGVCAGTVWVLVAEAMTSGPQTWATVLPLFIAYLLFPVLLAVAVLRYRLYDIDVVVNRSLVLVLGTSFAAIGYVTLVVLVGRLVDSRTSGYWLSLGSTVVVALAFQPLRLRVTAIANRMAFGSRAQPYEALAEFTRRLSATPSTETVLASVADAAGRAVSAHGATAFLDAPGLTGSAAFWGSDRAGTVHEHRVLVQERGVTLGSIGVSIPHGRPMRPADMRLLRAIADQAAVAFHNLAVEAQLNEHVLALDVATEELARSRARIIGADDDARRSLAAGISREVLPHLAVVSTELDDRAGTGVWPSQRIDDMVTGVNLALESLRELTHGVFPAQLRRSGLEPALRSYLRRHAPVCLLEIEPDALGQRFAARVEAAAYFAATRAVCGVRRPQVVSIRVDELGLRCTVTDADPAPQDLQEIRDRVEAVGGSLALVSGSLEVCLPLAPGLPRALSVAHGRPRG